MIKELGGVEVEGVYLWTNTCKKVLTNFEKCNTFVFVRWVLFTFALSVWVFSVGLLSTGVLSVGVLSIENWSCLFKNNFLPVWIVWNDCLGKCFSPSFRFTKIPIFYVSKHGSAGCIISTRQPGNQLTFTVSLQIILVFVYR